MVTNLPMILSMIRTWSFILVCLLTTVLTQAHPGHEGHEDGGDITWTYEHLTAHPLATALCGTVLALTVWLAFRHFRDKQRQATDAVIHNPAAGRNS
ncbi:MAG: hypothetical protein RL303_1434 [Verrucomicrobiota bacterium]|jgi:hypothetical protein